MLRSVPDPSRDDISGSSIAGDLGAGSIDDDPDRYRIGDTDIRLRRLIASVEPAIVFSSLAALCVPLFSDACTVDIVEGGRVRYRIAYPRDAGAGNRTPADPHEVVTTFACELRGWPPYTGVMTSRWHTRRPTAQDETQAAGAVAHAIRTVRRERLNDPTRSGGYGAATAEPGSRRRSR